MLRNAFVIGIHYLFTTFRVRSVLFFALLMPLIFTFVLGSVIGGGSSDEPVQFAIGLVNQDGGAHADTLIRYIQQNPSLDVQLLEQEAALSKLREDELSAVFIIPHEFSGSIEDRTATVFRPNSIELQMLTSGTQTRGAQSVEMALGEAISELDGTLSVAYISTRVGQDLGLFRSGSVSRQDVYAEVLQKADERWSTEKPVIVIAEPVTQLINPDAVPSGFDQSSPGMLVTFGLVFMLGGSTVLVVEREQGTLRRLLVMPMPKASILTGKLSGIWSSGIIQAAILILAGAFLFGVNWGQAPLALAIMVLVFGFSITSMGIMIAALARTYAQANALSNILMYSIAAFGGAWWPIEVVPVWMQQAAKLVPTYWAMQGFQDIVVRGFGLNAVLPEVLILTGFGLVFLLIGAWRFKYE